MIEAILLQIPPSVREVLQVRAVYYGNRLVYVEHVLLHHLVIPLLDLIQSPYHGIIVALVTECLLHVHQQVPHGDIFALVQHAGPFVGYPQRLVKMWGRILASSYCLRKASTSKHQNMYVTSAPGSADLKIGISNLAGASHFLSLLPLYLCWWPAVSFTVEYPSESSAPQSGEEGGEPPLLTVVHWDFGGLPCGHAAPVWVVSLASVISPTPEALPAC